MSQTESSRNYWRFNLFSTLTLFFSDNWHVTEYNVGPVLVRGVLICQVIKMALYSECSTELYDLIRPALNNCIPRPNKLDLQSCWKDMKFAKISPAIPTSLNGETQGTLIQRQSSSDHSFSSNINEGSPPFRCGRAASQIYPVMCAVDTYHI
jgi:hypothetical protein